MPSPLPLLSIIMLLLSATNTILTLSPPTRRESAERGGEHKRHGLSYVSRSRLSYFQKRARATAWTPTFLFSCSLLHPIGDDADEVTFGRRCMTVGWQGGKKMARYDESIFLLSHHFLNFPKIILGSDES